MREPQGGEVTVHGLHVWGTLVSWPNDVKVIRRWMPPAEAAVSIEETGLRALFASLVSGAAPVQPELPSDAARSQSRNGSVSGLASPATTGRFAAMLKMPAFVRLDGARLLKAGI